MVSCDDEVTQLQKAKAKKAAQKAMEEQQITMEKVATEAKRVAKEKPVVEARHVEEERRRVELEE